MAAATGVRRRHRDRAGARRFRRRRRPGRGAQERRVRRPGAAGRSSRAISASKRFSSRTNCSSRAAPGGLDSTFSSRDRMAARRPSSWRSWLSSALASLWRDMASIRAFEPLQSPAQGPVVGEAILLDEAQFDIPEPILDRGDHPVQRLDGLFFVAVQPVLDFGETFVQTFVGAARARGARASNASAPPRRRNATGACPRRRRGQRNCAARGARAADRRPKPPRRMARHWRARGPGAQRPGGPDGGRARRRGRAGESLPRPRGSGAPIARRRPRAARRRRIPAR